MNAHSTSSLIAKKWKQSKYHTVGGKLITPLNGEIPNFKISLRIKHFFSFSGSSDVIKNLPAMQKTQVWSPGQEDLLEKRMATHSSIITWRFPWTEEPDRLQRVGHDWATNASPHPYLPFQRKCKCVVVPLNWEIPKFKFSMRIKHISVIKVII